jgi:hypothetical protein
VDWLGEFFRTIPDAASALWQFGRGWVGVAITAGSALFAAVLLALAHRLRATYGWVSALGGAMASFIAVWWALGILPSAWVYYADGSKAILRDQIIPNQIAFGDYVVAGNFYQVVRDSVVAVEQAVAVVGFAVLALYVQKRYPRSLADSEEARPQSGGYK